MLQDFCPNKHHFFHWEFLAARHNLWHDYKLFTSSLCFSWSCIGQFPPTKEKVQEGLRWMSSSWGVCCTSLPEWLTWWFLQALLLWCLYRGHSSQSRWTRWKPISKFVFSVPYRRQILIYYEWMVREYASCFRVAYRSMKYDQLLPIK